MHSVGRIFVRFLVRNFESTNFQDWVKFCWVRGSERGDFVLRFGRIFSRFLVRIFSSVHFQDWIRGAEHGDFVHRFGGIFLS